MFWGLLGRGLIFESSGHLLEARSQCQWTALRQRICVFEALTYPVKVLCWPGSATLHLRRSARAAPHKWAPRAAPHRAAATHHGLTVAQACWVLNRLPPLPPTFHIWCLDGWSLAGMIFYECCPISFNFTWFFSLCCLVSDRFLWFQLYVSGFQSTDHRLALNFIEFHRCLMDFFDADWLVLGFKGLQHQFS